MKRILSFIFVLFILLFLSLYMGRYYTSYYDNQKTLTDDAIKRFEDDIKNGKDISLDNYIVEEKNYNNSVSKMGLKVSNYIEKGFGKILRYLLKHLDV